MSRSDLPAGLLRQAIANKNVEDVGGVLQDYVADLRSELLRKPKDNELTYLEQAFSSKVPAIKNSLFLATFKALMIWKPTKEFNFTHFSSIDCYTHLANIIRFQGDEDFSSKVSLTISYSYSDLDCNAMFYQETVMVCAAMTLKFSGLEQLDLLLSSIKENIDASEKNIFIRDFFFLSLLVYLLDSKIEDEKNQLIFGKISQEIDHYYKEKFENMSYHGSDYEATLYQRLSSIASRYDTRSLFKKVFDVFVKEQIDELILTRFSPSTYIRWLSIERNSSKKVAEDSSIPAELLSYFQEMVSEHMKGIKEKYITFWQEKEPALLTAIDHNVKEFTEILKLRNPREQGKVIFALWILKILFHDSAAVSFLTPYCFFQSNVYLAGHHIGIDPTKYGKRAIMYLLEESILSIRDELIFCCNDRYYHNLYSYIQLLKIEMAGLSVGSTSYQEKETKKIFCSKILNLYHSLKKSEQKSEVFTIPHLVAAILKELNQKVAVTLEFAGKYRFEISKFEVEILLARPFFSNSDIMPLDLFKEWASRRLGTQINYTRLEKLPTVVEGSMFEKIAGGGEGVEMRPLSSNTSS